MANLLKPPKPPKSFDPDDKGWAELRAWTDAMADIMVGQLQRINATLERMLYEDVTGRPFREAPAQPPASSSASAAASVAVKLEPVVVKAEPVVALALAPPAVAAPAAAVAVSIPAAVSTPAAAVDTDPVSSRTRSRLRTAC